MAIQIRGVTTTASGASPRTVNKPTGVAAGDLLLLQVGLTANIAPTAVPSGFTLVTGAAITGVTDNLRIYAKVADGSEPSTYDVTFASGNGTLGMLALYSDLAANLVTDGTPSTQT